MYINFQTKMLSGRGVLGLFMKDVCQFYVKFVMKKLLGILIETHKYALFHNELIRFSDSSKRELPYLHCTVFKLVLPPRLG